MTKPIVVYMYASGPNPWKVIMFMEELQIPYETRYMNFPEMKKTPFTKINPNGRVPAIEDPNTGISLWESCAIIEYLVDRYDPQGKFTYRTSPKKYQVSQWLFFQASGQGPYFGQFFWFVRFHQEQVQSAKDRYANEMKRIIRVFNDALEGREYLVGDKVTMADIACIPWNGMIEHALKDEHEFDLEKEVPNFYSWHKRLMERPAIKKTYEIRQQAMKDHL